MKSFTKPCPVSVKLTSFCSAAEYNMSPYVMQLLLVVHSARHRVVTPVDFKLLLWITYTFSILLVLNLYSYIYLESCRLLKTLNFLHCEKFNDM
jgi:hypothetical protein